MPGPTNPSDGESLPVPEGINYFRNKLSRRKKPPQDVGEPLETQPDNPTAAAAAAAAAAGPGTSGVSENAAPRTIHNTQDNSKTMNINHNYYTSNHSNHSNHNHGSSSHSNRDGHNQRPLPPSIGETRPADREPMTQTRWEIPSTMRPFMCLLAIFRLFTNMVFSSRFLKLVLFCLCIVLLRLFFSAAFMFLLSTVSYVVGVPLDNIPMNWLWNRFPWEGAPSVVAASNASAAVKCVQGVAVAAASSSSSAAAAMMNMAPFYGSAALPGGVDRTRAHARLLLDAQPDGRELPAVSEFLNGFGAAGVMSEADASSLKAVSTSLTKLNTEWSTCISRQVKQDDSETTALCENVYRTLSGPEVGSGGFAEEQGSYLSLFLWGLTLGHWRPLPKPMAEARIQLNAYANIIRSASTHRNATVVRMRDTWQIGTTTGLQSLEGQVCMIQGMADRSRRRLVKKVTSRAKGPTAVEVTSDKVLAQMTSTNGLLCQLANDINLRRQCYFNAVDDERQWLRDELDVVNSQIADIDAGKRVSSVDAQIEAESIARGILQGMEEWRKHRSYLYVGDNNQGTNANAYQQC